MANELWVNHDLARGLVDPHQLAGLTYTGSNAGDTFGVHILRNGVPSTELAGRTATGYLIRPDQQTVVIAGAISGSDVTVTLPSEAYAYSGRCSLVIRVSDTNGVKIPVFAAYFNIGVTSTDETIDPGELIPSLEDLLAQIDTMEAATAAAQDVVDTYEDRVSVAVVHSANLYNSAATRSVGIQLYADGGEHANADYDTTDYIPVTAGTKYYAGYWVPDTETWGTSQQVISICAFYDANKTLITPTIAADAMRTAGATAPTGAAYLRLSINHGTVTNAADYTMISAAELPTTFAHYWAVAPEIALKADLEDAVSVESLLSGQTKTDFGWHVGYISPSTGELKPDLPNGSTYMIYSDAIPCNGQITLNATSGYAVRYFHWDTATGTYGSAIGNKTPPYSVTLDDTTKTYRIQFAVASGATAEQAQAAINSIGTYLTVTSTIPPVITSETLDAIGMATKAYVDDATGKAKPAWHVGYVSASSGAVYPDAKQGETWCIYSDEIKTEYGFSLSTSTYNARWFWYDATTGDYVSGVGWQTPPATRDLVAGYKYRISFAITATKSDAENAVANIDDYITITQNTAADAGWIEFLPITDVYVGDVQQRIYFNELARYDERAGYFSVSASGATYPVITYTDRYIEFNPTAAATITVTISYYYHDRVAAIKTLTAHCNPAPFAAKKVMFLGDSYTANGGMVKWFKDHNGDAVTLYGTRTTELDGVTYQHEGRGGWTAGNYISSASKSGVSNPFYNPTSQTFDFSYYMANAGSAFTDVEIVVLLLGRNSGFPVSNLDSLDTIVSSIKAYNSQIMVVLICDSNLAADNSGAGQYMQNVHTANRQSHIYNTAFYERYKDSTSVVMCFANLNLDNVFDFETATVVSSITNPTPVTVYVDNVHPWNIPGLGKFGIAVNGLLRNILNQ